MDFHNFYAYSLSEDDIECINFLLYDYLPINFLKSGIGSRRIQDYVYMLLWGGLTENETLNVLVEALHHIPRRDILHECCIKNDLDMEVKYGKLIDSRRLLMFKIFNEMEEVDCASSLDILFSKLEISQNPGSLLCRMNMIVQSISCHKETLKYFSDCSGKIANLINDFQYYLEGNRDHSEQLWLKVTRNSKSDENDQIIVALEKGSETETPTFAFNRSDKVIVIPYDPKDSYPYPEMESSKSLCLIFDINNYVNSPRIGSEKDTQRLRETFSKLHFTIQLYENMTKEDMFKIAQSYATADSEKSGSVLICCILAHGAKDCIYDINREKVFIREFSLIFSAKNCLSYKNKPKLFLIQACQGELYHEGVLETVLQAESSQVSLSVSDSVRNVSKIRDYKMSDMVPEEADFIFGMATTSDHVAFRSTKKGSWYIQELCKMISEHCSSKDVVSLLTTVNGKVAKKNYKKKFCQMPLVSFTTRKKCYLTRPVLTVEI